MLVDFDSDEDVYSDEKHDKDDDHESADKQDGGISVCQKMRKKRKKSCLMISREKVHETLSQLGEYQIVFFGSLIFPLKKSYKFKNV